MIFNMSGGGGTGLNFTVVGNPQPTNPKENTIWVDTDVEITSWHFCVSQPTTYKEGAVWIQTDNFSDIEFNALKKNGIMAYPLLIKQYINGTWVDKNKEIYNGSEWGEWWHGKLYEYGKEWSHITGNLTFKGDEDCSISKGASSFSINSWNGDWGTEAVSCVAYFANPIDLTNFNTLVFEGSFSRGGGNPWNGIGVWSNTTSPSWTNCAASSNALTNGVSTIDVSNLSGKYYCGVWAYYTGTSVTCKLLKLE